MKKVLSFVVLLMASEVFAGNHDDKYRMNAELRFRYLNNTAGDEVNNLESRPVAFQRSIIGKQLRTSDLAGQLTLVHTYEWGNRQEGGYPNEALRELSSKNSLFFVGEAYGTWVPMEGFSFRMGRGMFDFHDDVFISNNDFEKIFTTFDHVLLVYHRDFFKVKVWYAELANSINSLGGDEDWEFVGLNVGFNSLPHIPNELFDMISLYVMLSVNDSVVNNVSSSSLRYGIVVSGKPFNFDYRLAFGAHMGTDTEYEEEITPPKPGITEALVSLPVDTEGKVFDVQLGYTLPDTFNLRFFAGFHMDSGNDDTFSQTRYDSFFYDMHNNAGEMDVFQWGNLTYYNIGVTVDPMEALTLGAAYFIFMASEAMDGFHAFEGGSRGFSSNFLSSDEDSEALGTELDVWATKKYGDYLDFSLVYSMFTPGEYFSMSDGSEYEPSSRVYLQIRLKF